MNRVRGAVEDAAHPYYVGINGYSTGDMYTTDPLRGLRYALSDRLERIGVDGMDVILRGLL